MTNIPTISKPFNRLFCKSFAWFLYDTNSSFGRGVVITTAILHSTKPEFRFCTGSNSAHGVSDIRDGENLWQWSWLEITLDAFLQSTIPQKQFIIIIIIIIIIINSLTPSITKLITFSLVKLEFIAVGFERFVLF